MNQNYLISCQYGRQSGRQQDSDNEDSDPGYEESYQPSRAQRPRTAINFVSAKQRAMSRKTASKTQQRSRDLLKMIELDQTWCDILDLPPVNEYDLYIRSFGSTNTRQVGLLLYGTKCYFYSHHYFFNKPKWLSVHFDYSYHENKLIKMYCLHKY